MRKYEGLEVQLTILDLGTRWRPVVSFALRTLYLRLNRARYPLGSSLGGPHNWSGCCGEKSCPFHESNPAVQLESRRYTDWAIPTPINSLRGTVNANSNDIVGFREPSLGYGTVYNLSGYQWLHTQQRNLLRRRCRHSTIRELRDAVLPSYLAQGGNFRYNGTRDTTPPTSTEEGCFLLGPLRGFITRPTELSSVSGVEWSWLDASSRAAER
jgi:hypothetical protein